MSRRQLALLGTSAAAAVALALSCSPAFAAGSSDVLTVAGLRSACTAWRRR